MGVMIITMKSLKKSLKTGYYNIFIAFALIFAVFANMDFISDGFRNVMLSAFAPMIFFGAGILYKNREKAADDIGKKLFFEIMMPYIWFSLFYTMVDAIKIVVLRTYDVSVIRQDLLDSITLYGCSVFWYLPVLFFAHFIYSLIRPHLKWPITLVVFATFSAIGIILFGNIDLLIAEADVLWKIIAFRLFALVWRTVLALLFMTTGEGAEIVANHFGKKKIALAIISILLTLVGGLLLYRNGKADIAMLNAGKAQFFFLGITLFQFGIYGISRWINQAAIFEFIGINARIVYLTLADFGPMAIAGIASKAFFEIFDNNFVKYIVMLATIVIVELIYIVIINRFLSFIVAKEPNKTFGLIERNDND